MTYNHYAHHDDDGKDRDDAWERDRPRPRAERAHEAHQAHQAHADRCGARYGDLSCRLDPGHVEPHLWERPDAV